METVTLALSKYLHTPFWVRRTNIPTVKLAKEHSKRLEQSEEEATLCEESKTLSWEWRASPATQSGVESKKVTRDL